jgi:hypothetical protein
MWLLLKVLWWPKRLKQVKRDPGVLLAQVLLSVVGQIGVPLVLVLGLPRLLDTPWSVMLLYQPDLTSWLMAIMLLSAGTGATRTLLAIMTWRRTQNHQHPVVQALRLAWRG